jgi:outer membrane lipoprotein-sorting protein
MRVPRAVLMAALLLAVGLAPAVQGAETARQILDRRKALDDTTRKWMDRHEHLKMTVRDGHGGERQRELTLYERRLPDGERQTIVFFESPAEVRGTAFLSYTHKGQPAEQWLYLPELKRTRQIAPRSRTESFVGTDLSYQDLDIIQEMASWSDEDARTSLRGEESVDGVPTHVIELVPRRPDIQYKKIVLWLGRDDLMPRRLEFYGDSDEPVKRVQQADLHDVGAIPVARHTEVETPAKGSKTVIESSDAAYDQHLDEQLFKTDALERGKP